MSNLTNNHPFEANFRADKGGGGERVSIRVLEIEPLYDFCQFVATKKTPALVKLCIGKDSEFINKLEPQSFAALAKKCIELNFPNAIQLMEGDPAIAVMLAPALKEMVEMAVSTSIDPALLAKAQSLFQALNEPPSGGAPSTSSSTPPAPSASAAATTGESSAPTPSTGSTPSSTPAAASAPPNS